jgi:DNA-binding transcriptional LysR family regulator
VACIHLRVYPGTMKLTAIDLNLFVALDALLAESSVTRAARRIGRSQPAVSHALQRARELFGDPLLVRVHDSFELTARAKLLAPRLRRILAEVAATVELHQEFDPAAINAVSIGATDYVGWVLVPHVVRALRLVSPSMTFRVRALEEPDELAPLASGFVDIALGTFPRVSPSLRSEVLFQERFVCAVRHDHPGIRDKLTLRRFLSLDHVLISSPTDGRGVVDYALADRGMSRTVAVHVPHFLEAPSLVAETDLIVTMAERVVARLAEPLNLRLFPCPIRLDPFDVKMIWHPRTDADSVSVWLREQVRAVAVSVFGRRLPASSARRRAQTPSRRSRPRVLRPVG